jgi:hypothetical protein
MSRILRTIFLIAVAGCMVSVGVADAEPMFLAKQYARCTTCHYSPAGGGLLTPYGRSLSQELATTGKQGSSTGAQTKETATGEPGFLWGAFGDRLGPLNLGVDIRPSHLQFQFPGGSSGMNLLMNMDALAAYHAGAWTVYGEVGRRPTVSGGGIYSYEYWAQAQSESGWGVRFGRFLPAYGVRFADHTDFNRSYLGFDKYDQVLGVEVSHTADKRLIQISAAPGRADSVLNATDNSGSSRAFTTTGRVQFDLSPKSALVVSGLYRDKSQTDVRNGAAGVAFGFAPVSRLSIWTEADSRMRQGIDGRSLVLVNETSFEAVRGLWLKFSPQLRTAPANNGQTRLLLEADLLPRTHWNIDLSFYRDRAQLSHLVTHTSLVQLHLYL